MQRVGFQRMARGFFGGAGQRAGAQEIDHDRHQDDAEGPDVGDRRRAPLVLDQALDASQITTPESRNSSAVSASAETASTLPWP